MASSKGTAVRVIVVAAGMVLAGGMLLRHCPGPEPPKPPAAASGQPLEQAKAPAPPRLSLPPRPQPAVPLPLARLALSYVGSDSAADKIWYQAINDPNTSAHDRSDLIEDLNEEGFPDPKNITKEDLPLVLKRLAMIEELAPNAMDPVNAAAFAEAYKDLVKMRMRLTRQ